MYSSVKLCMYNWLDILKCDTVHSYVTWLNRTRLVNRNWNLALALYWWMQCSKTCVCDMNESYHTWLSRVTYEWVMSHFFLVVAVGTRAWLWYFNGECSAWRATLSSALVRLFTVRCDKYISKETFIHEKRPIKRSTYPKSYIIKCSRATFHCQVRQIHFKRDLYTWKQTYSKDLLIRRGTLPSPLVRILMARYDKSTKRDMYMSKETYQRYWFQQNVMPRALRYDTHVKRELCQIKRELFQVKRDIYIKSRETNVRSKGPVLNPKRVSLRRSLLQVSFVHT